MFFQEDFLMDRDSMDSIDSMDTNGRVFHGQDGQAPKQLTTYHLQLTWVVGANPAHAKPFGVFRG